MRVAGVTSKYFNYPDSTSFFQDFAHRRESYEQSSTNPNSWTICSSWNSNDEDSFTKSAIPISEEMTKSTKVAITLAG